MQRVKMLKNYGEYKAGEVVTVSCNVAHGLVSKRVAVTYIPETIQDVAEDKMMIPARKVSRSRKNSYRTK